MVGRLVGPEMHPSGWKAKAGSWGMPPCLKGPGAVSSSSFPGFEVVVKDCRQCRISSGSELPSDCTYGILGMVWKVGLTVVWPFRFGVVQGSGLNTDYLINRFGSFGSTDNQGKSGLFFLVSPVWLQ